MGDFLKYWTSAGYFTNSTGSHVTIAAVHWTGSLNAPWLQLQRIDFFAAYESSKRRKKGGPKSKYLTLVLISAISDGPPHLISM
jgi:hypothetical protein